MDEILNRIGSVCKPLYLLFISIVISICSPIKDMLYVLGISFLFNIFTGIVTDIHVNHSDFSLKKAFEAIIQLTFYAALVFFVNNGCRSLGYNPIAQYASSWITLVVFYYYLTNILRNSTQVFPKSKALRLIYMILTTKIFQTIKGYFGIAVSESEKENLKP